MWAENRVEVHRHAFSWVSSCIFILFSLITQIGLYAYLKVLVTPMIAVYLLHCILYFIVHWWLGFDSA